MNDHSSAGCPEFTVKHQSLMAKLLTPDIYSRLKDVTTAHGYTLDMAIRPGILEVTAKIGMVAGDEESYYSFKELFDPVIEAWHGFKPDAIHRSDLDSSRITHGRLSNELVISTRVRAGRNIRGTPLPPAMSSDHRKEIMNLVQLALSGMNEEFEGRFHVLSELTREKKEELRNAHFLFQKPADDSHLTIINAACDWPFNRGIFCSSDHTFFVWCNEEDHMRIICMEHGGGVAAVFKRFCNALKHVEASIRRRGKEFMYNDHHGYICTCPTNIGTSLRASVLIKLSKLSEDYQRFESICNLLHLQIRGSYGEYSNSIDGIWDISNKERIGYTETELVQNMIDGVQLLIEMEQKLLAGECVDNVIPSTVKGIV